MIIRMAETTSPRQARAQFLAVSLMFCAALSPPAMAQPAPPLATFEQQLLTAAIDGPVALLRALDDVLRANPGLAATPDQATALARVAAAPVQGFVGASLPIYRGITDRIAAAAPAERTQDVRNAVSTELGSIAAADIRPVPPGGTKPLQPQQTTATREAEVAQRGYKVGSFFVYPDIQAAAIYDSNIYATKTNPRSDFVAAVSPRLSVESDWSRHSLTASVQADITRYNRATREDSTDWNGKVEGRIDATDTTQIVVGATQIAGHEDRTSSDEVDGFSITKLRETSGYLGVLQRVGDFAVRLGGAFERIEFDNVDGANGPINNRDRDRNRTTFGALVRYEANPKFRPFIEALGDIRKYDDAQDDFGFARSSSGYRAGVGALYRLSPTLRGDVFIGAMGRKADDGRFQNSTQVAFNGSLRWQAEPTRVFVLYADRSMEETTLFASPGYVYSAIGARVEQRLMESLTGLARVGFGRSEFLQSTRIDDDLDLSVGLRYLISEAVTLGVDYRYTKRISDADLSNHNRNQIFLRIGTQF